MNIERHLSNRDQKYLFHKANTLNELILNIHKMNFDDSI